MSAQAQRPAVPTEQLAGQCRGQDWMWETTKCDGVQEAGGHGSPRASQVRGRSSDFLRAPKKRGSIITRLHFKAIHWAAYEELIMWGLKQAHRSARTDAVVAGRGVGKEMETNGWIWYLLWRWSQQDLLGDWSLKSRIQDGFWVWGLNKWTRSQ